MRSLEALTLRAELFSGAGVLKGSEECDEVLFLVPGQLRAKDQIEELDSVLQRQRRPSCMYGGESLMPRSGNVLIGPSPVSHSR